MSESDLPTGIPSSGDSNDIRILQLQLELERLRQENRASAQQQAVLISSKSRSTYIILAVLFGSTGIHNFYAGRNATGAVQLIIFLLLGWTIVIPLGMWVISLCEVASNKTDGLGRPWGENHPVSAPAAPLPPALSPAKKISPKRIGVGTVLLVLIGGGLVLVASHEALTRPQLVAQPMPTAPPAFAALVDSSPLPTPATTPALAPKQQLSTAVLPAVSSKSYWLTSSSGLRHNSGCRYFHNSKGRECTASEGRPCSKCGG